MKSGKLPVFFCVSVLAVALAVPSLGQQNLDPRIIAYPQMVLYNGKVLTADDDFTIVEALAIRDGKFLARGTTSDILPLAGPKTRRIDLQGKTVVPGFIESHMHGWQGQTLRRGLAAIVFTTLEQGLEQLRKEVVEQPAGKYLPFVSFRNTISLKVTRWDLDKVAPNNPLALSFSTYEFNLNSLALKTLLDYLGTDDFPGVVKDAQTGEPNGQVRGLASGVYGYQVLPWPDDLQELKPRQLESLRRVSRNGVTMRIGRAPGVAISIVRDLWIEGKLPLRVRVTHEFLRDNPEPEKFLKRLGNLTGLGDDWFKIIGTIVQQPDGGSAAGAILTSRPKLRLGPKDNFGSYGQNRWEEYSNARESIQLAARYGWKIASVHSYGDQSTLLLLKAYEEAARERGGVLPGGPWVIDHNYVGTEETIALMKKLNVIPSVLAWWRLGGGMYVGTPIGREDWGTELQEGQGGFTPQMGSAMVYMYGADRLSDDWSLGRAFIDAGLRPVAETAGPPLESIEAVITRKDDEGRVWAPQEKVNRQEALWMKTRWVAYISSDEDKLGSIEDGKLADLVVLDGDYLTVPEEEIGDLSVVMTVVGGKVMYEGNR